MNIFYLFLSDCKNIVCNLRYSPQCSSQLKNTLDTFYSAFYKSVNASTISKSIRNTCEDDT